MKSNTLMRMPSHGEEGEEKKRMERNEVQQKIKRRSNTAGTGTSSRQPAVAYRLGTGLRLRLRAAAAGQPECRVSCCANAKEGDEEGKRHGERG